MNKHKTLDDLGPILPLIYEACEFGTGHAKTYFPDNNVPICPALAPAIARHWIRLKLYEQTGILADFEPNDLPNNGIEFVYAGYTIKVWKSVEGDLPPAGPSKQRQHFLRQLRPAPLQMTFGEILVPVDGKGNLIVLWTVDKEYKLHRVTLVCTYSDLTGQASVAIEWQEDISHPAFNITPSQPEALPEDIPWESEESEDEDDAKDVGDD